MSGLRGRSGPAAEAKKICALQGRSKRFLSPTERPAHRWKALNEKTPMAVWRVCVSGLCRQTAQSMLEQPDSDRSVHEQTLNSLVRPPAMSPSYSARLSHCPHLGSGMVLGHAADNASARGPWHAGRGRKWGGEWDEWLKGSPTHSCRLAKKTPPAPSQGPNRSSG